MNNELIHHGIKGQKWGVRNGPPYPLKVHQNRLNRFIGEKTGHYKRQQLNTNLPKNEEEAKRLGWRKLSAKASAMHQHHQEGGVRNTKWVSPDGHREVVYTGKGNKQHITYDPRDVGTYNYYDYKKNPLGHFAKDVLPYMLVGNSKYDKSTKAGRIKSTARSLMNKPASSVKQKTKNRGKKRVDKIVNKKVKRRTTK